MKPQGFFLLLVISLAGCGFYQSKINAENAAITLEPLEANFQSIRDHVFRLKCLDCHKPGAKAGDAPLDTYENTMAIQDYVVPGDPDGSGIVKEIVKGKMPPKRSNLPPVTPEELQVIRQWIAEGAKP